MTIRKRHWLSAELTQIVNALMDGWFLTLLLGGLHSAYAVIPPIGFWWCVGIAWVLAGIAATPLVVRDVRTKGMREL